jgi:enamine deaminase RidA (YjgF/YER057c/UK114 family)
MHCLPGSTSRTSDSHITRVDLTSQFDSVSPDGSTYTVGDKQYFMPYVPGYVTSGPGEWALFSITADDAGADGAAQVRLVVAKLQRVLAALGLTFDDVVVLWNRCARLDETEEDVLMKRSRDFDLPRPLAEAVLEVVETDPNPDGAAVEYIVVAKLPRSLAEVRSFA